MIERLQRALEHVEELSPEAQEDIAIQIEEMTEPIEEPSLAASHPLMYAILERYADLRRAMRPPRGPGLIGDVDTLIAATAMEHELTIVTLDRRFHARAGTCGDAAHP